MELKERKSKDFTVGIISFFAGAGFLDLGFDSVDNFETVFVNEYHEPFIDIYKSSRRGLGIPEPLCGYFGEDVTELLSGRPRSILADAITQSRRRNDFIGFIGGPPCPDFSIGGKNRGSSGENGKLSATYVASIIQNQPDFFLFENVKGLYRTRKHREFFDMMKERLIQAGYHLTERAISVQYRGSFLRDHGRQVPEVTTSILLVQVCDLDQV